MKPVALLLVIPVLLLTPALSAEALSLKNDFLFEQNNHYFDPSNNPVNFQFEDEAIYYSNSRYSNSRQTSPIPGQWKIDDMDRNTSYNEVTEKSMSIWMKDAPEPAPSFVPEPASLILLGSGLLFLAEMNRRWKKSNR